MKKKTKTKVEKFTGKVTEWGDKLLDENKGYLLLAFDELEDGTTMCRFNSKGKLPSIAECLYTCMEQNPMFEYVVVSAANALAQARAMQGKMQEELTEIVMKDGNNQN